MFSKYTKGDQPPPKAKPKLSVKCKSPLPLDEETQKAAAGVPYASVLKGY